jgi:threonyl-tRNA synthetase
VEVDERDETLGKRIRDTEVEKVPYVIVWGDKESEQSLAVRVRGRGQATVALPDLLDELAALVAPSRS